MNTCMFVAPGAPYLSIDISAADTPAYPGPLPGIATISPAEDIREGKEMVVAISLSARLSVL